MKKHIFAVLAAGFCWGFTGLFTRHLTAAGIPPTGVVVVRCGFAALLFGLLILFRDPKQFLIRLKDIWIFLGSGLLSLLFFTYCYFNAMTMMDLSAAVILLYTAPCIVMLLSALFFRESVTPIKIIAVLLSLLGCGLVSGITGGFSVSATGCLFGLGAGLGYALYTVFSRFALQRGYHSDTVNFYSCLLAALGALIIWGCDDLIAVLPQNPGALLWALGSGALTCFVPYLLYTFSLTGLENSTASVLASVEPVTATLCGVIFFRETLSLPAVAGILLVLSAIVLLNSKAKPKKQ